MQARIHRYGLVDSTNERALVALDEDRTDHGDVHVATGQTNGRGRRGRVWQSVPGSGLYLSLVVKPPVDPEAAPLTLAGGLAALAVCRELGLEGAQLDWPNDLVTPRGKLAGVLVESRDRAPAQPSGRGWIVGLGINLARQAVTDRLAVERAVTSLEHEGLEVDQEEAEAAAVHALRWHVPRAWEQPQEVLDEAFATLRQAGRSVRVEHGLDVADGQLVALDAERGLGLEADGRRRWLSLPHVRSVVLTEDAHGAASA